MHKQKQPGSKPVPSQYQTNYNNIKWGDLKWNPPVQEKQKRAFHIIKDIEPYKAVGGKEAGEWITSRSKEREYLRRNNFIQVGNEKDYFFKYGGKSHDNPTREW